MNNIFSKPSIHFTVIKKHFEYNSTRIDDCFKKNGRYPIFTVKPIYDDIRKYIQNLGHVPYSFSTPDRELAKYAGKNDEEYLNNIIKNYVDIRLAGGDVKCLNSNRVKKVLGKLFIYYGQVLSNSVVDYDGVKSEYFYSFNSGRINVSDKNYSDIDLVNDFFIRNENKKNNDGKSDYITTSFYLAVKFKPGLILGEHLGDCIINKDNNSKHKFHIDLSNLMEERARSIESIYYYTSGDIEIKMNNQDIKEITEIESLFQNIKINRLYC
jgi:hypothetical protein